MDISRVYTMKLIIVLCACVALARAAIDNWQRTADGSLYYVEFEPKYTWYEALQQCARKNMTLVTFDSQDKAASIFELFNRKLSANYTPNEDYKNLKFWTAGYLNNVAKQLQWVTTGQVENKPYYEKYYNLPGDHCAGMFMYEAKWDIGLCSRPLAILCEENPLLKAKNQELDDLRKSCEPQANRIQTVQDGHSHTETLDVSMKDKDVVKNVETANRNYTFVIHIHEH